MKLTDFSFSFRRLPSLVSSFLLGCLMLLLFFGAAVYAEDETAAELISAQTPYELHGPLSVRDSLLTDQDGQPMQLRGVSTMNLAWYPQYVTEEAFRTLRDTWNINTIRLAMYTAENGGYCTLDDEGREKLKELVVSGVEYASNLGLYVIVDWHILSDGDPNINKDAAIAFFQDITLRLQGFNNVIYEVCNEPNGGVTWDTIRSYAAEMIDVIRVNAPQAVILVGTPTWSQDVDIAASNPIDRDNIMYSLHFYAASHKEELRKRAISAIQSGLPLFVSEFGISDASGNGEINTEEGDEWLALLDYYNISYVIWNLSNKAESSALLTPECTRLDSWEWEDLTLSAQWYVNWLNGGSDAVAMSFSLPFTDGSEESAPSQNSWTLANGCSVTVEECSSWFDGSSNFVEYNVTIQNNTPNTVNGWRVRITWSDVVTLHESWNCDIGASNDNWLAIPLDYNKVIAANSSVSFGWIVSGTTVPCVIDVVSE